MSMSDFSRWRVMIVDDDYDSIRVVSTILAHHNIEVRLCRSGSECLALLDKWVPSLVITDLALPAMDGWQLLAALRADPRTADLPIVAITAYHSVDVAADAAAAGFAACFSKPVDARTFVERLARVAG